MSGGLDKSSALRIACPRQRAPGARKRQCGPGRRVQQRQAGDRAHAVDMRAGEATRSVVTVRLVGVDAGTWGTRWYHALYRVGVMSLTGQ